MHGVKVKFYQYKKMKSGLQNADNNRSKIKLF